MGSDKGILEINGKIMIESIINALKPLVDDIIIIANNSHYDYLGYKVYCDLVTEAGILAGIYTALSYSTTEKNLVTSCDIPFINTQLLSYIIDNASGCEVAVPVHNGKTEPLCAIYTKSCANRFKRLITNEEFKITQCAKLLLNKANICF